MKLLRMFLFVLLAGCQFLRIDADVTGLQPVPGQPFATGTTPSIVTYSPIASTGNVFAAVPNLNDNTVSVYAVDSSTGAFTPVPGSPFSTGTIPIWTAFSPVVNGNLFAAVANEGANTVSVYQVDQTTGVFTPVPGSPFLAGSGPLSVDFSPVIDGNLFAAVANQGDNDVTVYQVNTTTGVFITVGSFSAGNGPTNATFSPITNNGQIFLAVANGMDNTVSIFSVNPASGNLIPVTGSPFAAPGQPNNTFFSSIIAGNLWLGVPQTGINSVAVFNVNQTTGVITEIPGSPFPTGNLPLAGDYSFYEGNLIAAISNFLSNDISIYNVDLATGVYTPATISPFPSGASTDGLDFSPIIQGNLYLAVTNFTINQANVFQVQVTSTLPTVTSVSPNSGSTQGGTTVVITGTNFTNVTAVNFGSNPASSFIVNSPTQITAISPPGTGTVDITVTTLAGTSAISASDQFTYIVPPLLPPPSFTGVIKKNIFLDRSECYLQAKWTSSPTPNIISYRIYRDNILIAQIPATSAHVFTKSLKKCTANGFSITAVNSDNMESAHTPLTIVRKSSK